MSTIRERDAAYQTGTALGNLIGGNAALRAEDRRTLLAAGDALAAAVEAVDLDMVRGSVEAHATDPKEPERYRGWFSEQLPLLAGIRAALAAWKEATDGR